MTNELELYIGEDGDVQCVYDDAIAELFDGETMTTRRASHVEPDARGGWIADMSPVGGPMIGADGVACDASDVRPFKTRAEALDAEREWLSVMLSKHVL